MGASKDEIMLKTVALTEKFHSGAPCVLLVGGFDGLHTGHQALLKRAKGFGLPVVVMTISGGKGDDLFTFPERENVFRRFGADFAFELPFGEIRTLSAEEFCRLLTEKFSPQAFFCGEDFRFGHNAAGTPNFLEAYTRVRVEREPIHCLDGEKISASSVKKRLENGDAVGAARLLGYPFFLQGKVEEGRKVGRTMDFPTANIRYPSGKFSLKKAVYEVEAEIDGKVYRGIANYGARPTFDDGEVWTESCFDGFSGNLYGKTLTIGFTRCLREIVRFASAEDLRKQLKKDVERVRKND